MLLVIEFIFVEWVASRWYDDDDTVCHRLHRDICMDRHLWPSNEDVYVFARINCFDRRYSRSLNVTGSFRPSRAIDFRSL